MSPLSATFFGQQRHWADHYFISTSFAVLNLISIVLVFRLETQESKILSLDKVEPLTIFTIDAFIKSGQAVAPAEPTRDNLYSQIFRIRALHLLAFFSIVYVGVEVTLGGESFLSSCRDVVITQRKQDGLLHLLSKNVMEELLPDISRLDSSED